MAEALDRPVILAAPLSGWCAPLTEVPDEAFATGLVGAGLAIDPVSAEVLAPCDATVVGIAAANHALTLRSSEGCELLIHVGIDTVELQGVGFTPHTRPGARVRRGERLLSFDLDALALRARSLVTPILVPAGSAFRLGRNQVNRAVRAGEFLMELLPQGEAPPPGAGGGGAPIERRMRLALQQGLHARPAARIAALARSHHAEVLVIAHGREANARSAVALMALGTRFGDELCVRAAGTDAPAVLEALAGVLLTPETHGPAAATGSAARRAPRPAQAQASAEPGVLRGITASTGLAVGSAYRLDEMSWDIREDGQGAAAEAAALEAARSQVRSQLEQRCQAAAALPAAREIAQAHLQLLEDPQLLEDCARLIEQGRSAAFAWRTALAGAAAALRALEDPLLRERAADLEDLAAQVVRALLPELSGSTPVPPPHAIVLAREVLPSQMPQLQAAAVAGICMAEGGATSHVAILCAAMGIPALVALGPQLQSIAPGASLVLDAAGGRLEVAPAAARLAEARASAEAQQRRRASERAAARRACVTADGVRIEVFANIGSLAEARAALDNGAEGCGLLRTEFLFLERQSAPSAPEQTAQYQQIAAVLGARPLTIRTLDAGGDKPIAYLALPREENPALGLRGIRTSLAFPELLRTQLTAILALRDGARARILLPMITDVEEIRTVRTLIAQLRVGAGESPQVQVGVMIETPAAALRAQLLCAEADFISVGTNDLTQYTLAMDRGNPQLAPRLSALHPAVLELIGCAARGARSAQRHAAVCGALASEPHAAPLLVGLGINELSAVPARIPAIKQLLGRVTVAQCRELARQALALESASQVHELLRRTYPEEPAGT